MLYLTGIKLLHDESDYEDPCASLNIPANNNYKNNPDFGDDSDNDEFN